MAGASAESCRFVVLRSPRGRLGSVLYTCKRLRRVRGRVHRYLHISTGPEPDIGPWCVKTPPLFYVVKGVPPLSPTSFGVLPLLPLRENGFDRKGCGVFTRQHRAGAQVPKVWDPELSGEPQAPAYAV